MTSEDGRGVKHRPGRSMSEAARPADRPGEQRACGAETLTWADPSSKLGCNQMFTPTSHRA